MTRIRKNDYNDDGTMVCFLGGHVLVFRVRRAPIGMTIFCFPPPIKSKMTTNVQLADDFGCDASK